MKQLRILLPYNKNLSKNKNAQIGHGRFYKSHDVKAAQSEVILLVSQEMRLKGISFEDKKKCHISAMIYKPDNRSDAHNFIDNILDAVKRAINVDDRYYAISGWDYEIDATKPRIALIITQDA